MYDQQTLVLANRWPTGRVTSGSITTLEATARDRRPRRSLQARRRLGALLMLLGARLLQVPEHPPRPRLPQPNSVRLGRG